MRQPISGLSDVLESYEGLIVDLWGVMHNGQALFPNAVAALRAAKDAGKSVTLLSNAPRRREAALANLVGRLGLSQDLFDDLVTSGEVAWQAIQDGRSHEWGPRCFFFGADKDLDIKLGLNQVEFVEDMTGADWILNVGPESGHTSAEPFMDAFDPALAKGVPMVCANPDLVVQRGTELEICAGSVAKAYEQRGGQVVWYGKPHAAVYQAVYESCDLEPGKLLAVGDSFKTDVRGANAQGIDVLYVNSGIHGSDVGRPINMDRIEELAEQNQATPTYVSEVFRP